MADHNTVRRIVITGGPSTGKTSVINELIARGYKCLEEISRQITREARQNGIEQLFLADPILFSEKLLDGRKAQYHEALSYDAHDFIFLDRGIPDVVAYMEYSGDSYPSHFTEACEKYPYDQVFILAPWQEIYKSDSERYENFEQALMIHDQLLSTYRKYGYDLLVVPFESISNRADFILNNLHISL